MSNPSPLIFGMAPAAKSQAGKRNLTANGTIAAEKQRTARQFSRRQKTKKWVASQTKCN